MQIDWWTFALQALNFLVLVWLLQRFLFKPVKAVIEKRKALSEEAFARADAEKADAEAALRRYEEAREKLAQERQEMLRELQNEMRADREKMLDEARKEAQELLDAARESLSRERRTALDQLRQETAATAIDVASQLLAESGAAIPSPALLDRLMQYLDDMPVSEQERLRSDLAADSRGLAVVTVAPLSPEDEHDWTERLSGALGEVGRIEFSTDASLLGGAELHFPHSVLKFSWREQLLAAQKLLRES